MRLLIIGSIDSNVQEAIEIAQTNSAKVSVVNSIEEAMTFIRLGKGADLVLVDVHADIASLVQAMKDDHISTPIIAYGIGCSPKTAVAAIKAGAKEFLPLPPDARLISAILAAISDDTKPIIGASPAIHQATLVANKIATSSANVLITGSSGTGKEVFARYIHSKSNRKDKAFVPVNCAAIPPDLLESELFGHEKGAFTGATNRRIGKFEESSGGTLMLDEISEMDLKLQAKLLRAIQEKEIDRVGGSAPVKVDLRIIATSNRDLVKAIANGQFREDLYFRLNVINIELPRLADRVGDIEALVAYFIKKYTSSNELQHKTLSAEALSKMQSYSWPGNVRELENVIHRAVLLSEGSLIKDTDLKIKELSQTTEQDDVFKGEKQLLFNTVGYCLGDLNKAANILGISINILKEKLEQHIRV